MAFRAKRSDTLVKNIERTYGVDNSQSQLFKAMNGKLDYHPRTRNIFISFHSEDFGKAQGLRLMMMNPKLNLDLEDVSRKLVRSNNESYVRSALKNRLQNADVVLCVLGNGTGSRDWVDWELETALSMGIPVCGVRIRGTYGKFPNGLKMQSTFVAQWDAESITRAIEAAIARGV